MKTPMARRKDAQLKQLLDRVSAWEEERPELYGQEPKYVSSMESGMFFGSFLPFYLIGLFVSMGILYANAPNSTTPAWLLAGPLWMPFTAGFGAPTVLAFLIDIVLLIIHLNRMRSWRAYCDKINAWRTRGIEEFSHQFNVHPTIQLRVQFST